MFCIHLSLAGDKISTNYFSVASLEFYFTQKYPWTCIVHLIVKTICEQKMISALHTVKDPLGGFSFI